MRLSAHELAYIARQEGFSEEDAPTMVAIIMATNGGDTDYLEIADWEERKDQLHGLAAISDIRHPDKLNNWRDPFTNLKMAKVIFSKGGFTNWEAFNTNDYKAFLVMAHNGVENPVRPLVVNALDIEKVRDTMVSVLAFVMSIDKRIEATEADLGQLQAVQNSLKNSIGQIRSKFSA